MNNHATGNARVNAMLSALDTLEQRKSALEPAEIRREIHWHDSPDSAAAAIAANRKEGNGGAGVVIRRHIVRAGQ